MQQRQMCSHNHGMNNNAEQQQQYEREQWFSEQQHGPIGTQRRLHGQAHVETQSSGFKELTFEE
jgi:hypothetical protein